MRAADLKNKNIVIWGLGREGKAAAEFIHKQLPGQFLVFVDEAPHAGAPENLQAGDQVARNNDEIKAALHAADIIIKSPGVSLSHPLLMGRHAPITSLLNLWFAEPRTAITVCVTGTKGKSTTTSLLAHTLNALGKKAVAAGNIGVPITEVSGNAADIIVIETSSYQAADFFGTCDIGILTSLYPDHLDWHTSLAAYYRDKLNLLGHSRVKIVNAEALETIRQHNIALGDTILFNHPSGIHVKDGAVYDQSTRIGAINNRYLSRSHNLVNVCGVLTAIRQLGFDLAAALRGMEDFQGLPHRQQELGEKDGVLFVDDSIATTPQAAIAAMEAYTDKSITLIAGGYDRGIDYAPLTDYVLRKKIHTVICMGPSGQRIYDALKQGGAGLIYMSTSMPEAVDLAKRHTPKNGVVLLSPAAPSYGMFKDFVERGLKFAACVNQSSTVPKEKTHA